MNNRVPVYVLIILVLVAVIWRIANPYKPPVPGPLGSMPNWSSSIAIGDMASSKVNPKGDTWAGAWNKTGKGSAIHFISFSSDKITASAFTKKQYISSVTWADDSNLCALVVNSLAPAKITSSQIVFVNSATGKHSRIITLKLPISHILDWPIGSSTFLAELTDPSGAKSLVQISETGEVVGKRVTLPDSNDTRLHKIAASDPTANIAVVAMNDDSVGSSQTYYYIDFTAGTAQKLFASPDLKGKAEEISISPLGVAIVVSNREKFSTLLCRLNASTLVPLLAGNPTDWKNLPQVLRLSTYNGGFEYSPLSGKTRRLFDLTKLGKSDERWREEIIGGRLYPIKGDAYVNVTTAVGYADIRTINSDGTAGNPILPAR